MTVDLKFVQKELRFVLVDFSSFCSKNNIDYFIIAGTALGAVRHQGFIPWDDDIDIGMARDQYDRFLTIAPLFNKNHLKILNFQTISCVEHSVTKIAITNIKFLHSAFKDKYDHSVHVDIFPFDWIPKNRFISFAIGLRTRLIKEILYIKSLSKTQSKNFIKNACLALAQFLLLPLKSSFLAKRANKIAKSSNKYKHSEYLTNWLGAYSFKKERINKNDLGTLSTIQFENIKVKCPENIINFLIGVYGEDFMTPKKRSFINQQEFLLDDEN